MVARKHPENAAMEAAYAARQAECRSDFLKFFEWVVRDERGRPTRNGAIHRAMYLHVRHCWKHGKHPGVLAPVEHGKTTLLIVGLTAFELGVDPSLRIKIISSNDDPAMKRVVGVTSILRSPAYRAIFPRTRFVDRSTARKGGKKDTQTKHEIFLDREGHAIDPSVEATGILMSGTGSRADRIFYDDVVEQRNAIDMPVLRGRVIDTFDNVWMQRMKPGALALFVGQPWHNEDLVHELESREGWSFLRASIARDFRSINLEVTNPPADYPIPERAAQAVEGLGEGSRLVEPKKGRRVAR